MNIRCENWNNDWYCDQQNWKNNDVELRGGVSAYHKMVVWINENIHDPMNNVMWTYANCPVFRFRNSQDQVWFMLRWQ